MTLPALSLAQEPAAAAGVASTASGTPALAGIGSSTTGTRGQQDAVLVPAGTGSTPPNPVSQPAGLGAQPRVSASGQVLLGTGDAGGIAPGVPSPPQAAPKRPSSR